MNKNNTVNTLININEIHIYDQNAWVEFRETPKNLGHNKTIHFAIIKDKTDKLHRCYVKLMDVNTPALLCEALGWIIASSSNVPCSSFACIVMVPIDELKKSVALPDWTNGYSFYPAWCTEIVDGKSLSQIHKWEYWLYRKTHSSKSPLKSLDVTQIAAMDIWINNQDRNVGNVIKSKQGKFVAIDHEAILHELLWVPTNKIFEERSLVFLAKSHLSSQELDNFFLGVGYAGNSHEEVYKLAKNSIKDITVKICGQENADYLYPKINSFLEVRSVAGWLSSKLGVIV